MEGKAPSAKAPPAGPRNGTRRGRPQPSWGCVTWVGAAVTSADRTDWMTASMCARDGIETATNAAITIQYAAAAKRPETMVRMALLLSVWDPLLVLAYGESGETVSGLQGRRDFFFGPGGLFGGEILGDRGPEGIGMDEERVVAGLDVEDEAPRRIAGLNERTGQLVDLRYGDQYVRRDPDEERPRADPPHALHQSAALAPEVMEIHGPREVQVGVRVVTARILLALML